LNLEEEQRLAKDAEEDSILEEFFPTPEAADAATADVSEA